MSKKSPVKLPVLGNAFQKLSPRKQKTQHGISYPGTSLKENKKLGHETLSRSLSFYLDEVEEPVESAMQIRIAQIDAELQTLDQINSTDSLSEPSKEALSSFKAIDDMMFKYTSRLKVQMDLLSVYPEHELVDIIACECVSNDHLYPIIEVFDILVDKHVKSYNIYIMKMYEDEFSKARSRRRSIQSSMNSDSQTSVADTSPRSVRAGGLVSEPDSAIAGSSSSSSLKQEALFEAKSRVEHTRSKLRTGSDSAKKVEVRKLVMLPEIKESSNLFTALVISDSDDDEDSMDEIPPLKSAFKQHKSSIYDEDDESPYTSKYVSVVKRGLPTFGGENFVFGATILEERRFDKDETEDLDDVISTVSSYCSLSDTDDPVNLLPPLIFADLYRNNMVPVTEPTIDAKNETRSKSIMRIKENNLKFKSNIISSGTIIPTVEALLFFDIIHNEGFREYFLTDKEIDEYPIIRNANTLSDDELNATMYLLNEQISKGYGSAFWPRAKCYMAKKLWDLALADLNQFLMLDSDAKNNASIYWARHQIHLIDGNLDLVINDLDRVTEIQRDHIGAAYTKGRLYQELGLYKPAIISYNTLCTLKNRHPEPFLRRGHLYEILLENELSHDDYRKVVRLDPMNIYASYRCGLYYFEKGFFTDALKEFQKLLQMDGTNGLFFSLKGRAYASLNRWAKAAANINMAIKLIPNDSRVFYYRGCLLSETDPVAAIKDFSVSILIEDGPSNTDSYYQRGLLYHKTEQFECAVDDYLSAVGMRSGYHVAYLNLGIIYMVRFNDCERALEYYDKTISCDPNHIKAYIYRGDVYYTLFKARKELSNETCMNNAIKDYSRAMHLAPWDPLPYMHRGRLLLEKGLLKESKCDLDAASFMRSESTFLDRCISLSFKKEYAVIIKDFSRFRNRLDYKVDPLVLLEVGKAHMNLGAYDTAIGFMSKALADSETSRHQILLQIGHCQVRLKNWSKAVNFYSQSISVVHGFSEAYFYRGVCKLQMKNDRGLADIIRAIKLDSKFFAAQFFCAGYYYELHDYAKCIEYADSAFSSEPTSAKTLLLRGSAQSRLNQNSLAISDFNLVIKLDPKNSLAFYHRATAYYQTHNIDKAITDYTINLLIKENASAYRNRGLLYWHKNDSVNALIDLKAARQLQSDDANIRCLLAICLQRVHSYEESVQEFNTAIRINPFMIEAYVGRGNVHVIIGNLASARRDYSRVLHLFPRNQEAFVNIAYTYQMEGKSKKAWDILSELLALDPNSTMGLEGRAIVNYHMKNYFNALIDISRALEIEPNNAEFLTNKGLIYKAMNDYSASYNSFMLATKSDPKYALAFYNIGNMYFKNARMSDAIKSYSKVFQQDQSLTIKALAINANDKLSLLNRGITHVMQEEYKEAMADFDKCIAQDVMFAQAYTNRGHLKHTLGDFVGAEVDYTKSLEIQPGDNMTLYKRAKTLGLQGRLLNALKDINTSYIYETTRGV